MTRIVYVLEKTNEQEIIFLAGPTHRDGQGESWRPEAVQHLINGGFDGIICCPEFKNETKPEDWTYSRQLDWEAEYLKKAKVILFWIPRDMKKLPGLTTNIEFGEWMHSGKIVIGAPENADHMQYIKERCSRLGIPWSSTLEGCADNAITKLKESNDHYFKPISVKDILFQQNGILNHYDANVFMNKIGE